MAEPQSPAPRSFPWLLIGLAAAVVLAGLACLYWPRPTDDGKLHWGGDATGGEPYLILDKGKTEPGGFESEMVGYLARDLDRTPVFHQNDWSSLPGDLRRRDIDVVFNGYEWMPEREAVMLSTAPYYAYRIRLIVHRDSKIKDWGDLKRKSEEDDPLTVGVLRDSAAHRYLVEKFGDDIEIVALKQAGVTFVMSQVAGKKMDATVQDVPATVWYLERWDKKEQYKDLHAVGKAIQPSRYPYYVAYVRSPQLRDELNASIRKRLSDGTFKRILEKYGLWDADQEGLVEVGESWPPPESPRTTPPWQFFWQLVLAARFTVGLAVLSFPVAIVLGLLIALGRLYGPWVVRAPLAAYVEVVRGTPLLLQLIFLFYFLPEVGVVIPAFTAGVLGLALNYAAYEAEIYRAGLQAIPRGQMEAALSLGMTPTTALWRVIVPQAVRIVIPPVTNDFIALFKDTAVCSVIAVQELTQEYQSLANTNPNRMAELAVMAGLLYLIMSYPLSLLARWLEARQEKGKVTA